MNAIEEYTDKAVLENKFIFQLLTVHDEIITMTQKSTKEWAMDTLVEKMTKTVILRCPIETDPVAVYTYGSAK
jgi:DNA polymerase I-like protein with 3'-5' exonuclease and polymerase domains